MKRAFRVSAIVISLLTAVSIMTACGSGKNENSSADGSKASAAPVSSSSEVKSEISESSTVSEVSEEDKQSSVTETTQTSKEEAQESSKESSMFDISEAMEELNKYRSSAPSEPVSDNDIQKELSRLLESNVQTSPAVPITAQRQVRQKQRLPQSALSEIISKKAAVKRCFKNMQSSIREMKRI